jgi:hypothetical protein
MDGGILSWRLALADRTTAEDLKPVPVDLEGGSAAKLFEQWLDAAFLELDNDAAVRADQVVVMPIDNATEQVRVAAVRLVQPIQNAVLNEQIERPEDSRATDARLGIRQLLEQLIRREGPFGHLNRIDDSATRTGHPVPGLLQDLERSFDWIRVHQPYLRGDRDRSECNTLAYSPSSVPAALPR